MAADDFNDSARKADRLPAAHPRALPTSPFTALSPVEPPAGDAASSPPDEARTLRVVIETPRGSRVKYKFDEALQVFTPKSVLPVGMVFPFNFGFVPQTLGGDGDPLDALVLMEEPLVPGCVVSVRLLAVMQVEQIVHGVTERNDRLLTVPAQLSLSPEWTRLQGVSDLPDTLLEQLDAFFVQYHRLQGKRSRLLGLRDASHAWTTVREALQHGKAHTRP